MTTTWHDSVCPHDCPSVCALEVERLEDGRLGRVRGSERNAYTAGVICAKVARYAERFHHPERLSQPLRRRGPKGSGDFEPIGWDDALDEIAERLTRAAQRHGPESVWPYYYAGTMGLVQRDGINRLTHCLGYSRFKSTICVELSDTGWRAGAGRRWGVPMTEMAESDLIVVWGCNPVATHVNAMTHISRARKQRGARLVVVDPFRSGTARQADTHLAPRPGTDGALACAVMHVAFRDGHADRDYLERYTDVPDELEKHLESRTPEWAAAITGLEVGAIEDFARLYGSTQRSYIRIGFGFTRSRNGAAAMHAVSCLPAVTGAWRHRGGGALYNMGDLYELDTTLIEGRDRIDPSTRALDQSRLGPVLTGEPDALQGGPPVTALLVQNTNPMAVCPELGKVHKGFARDDLFVAVHEQLMTDTARAADIVLPATMFLEHDDIYKASAHDRLQVARKLFEPFAECRENHAVIRALARRLGARHPGFDMTAIEIVEAVLAASGLPDAAANVETGGHPVLPDFATGHFLDGFPTPTGRFRFRPDWASFGPDHVRMPALPDHLAIIDEASEEHPFRLVAAPARQFLNTSFTEMPTSRKREGRPTAQLHPDDLKALGLAPGDLVRIENRRGSVPLHAGVLEGLPRGVVVVESIWPNDAYIEGIGINALISAEPAPPNGGAVIHDNAVRLRPEA
jgi:anaerobic selenocysteine-containing dehydrogenase